MLLVPEGGAVENVSVVPDTVYVDGSCTTPVMMTSKEVVDAGAIDIVKAVVDPLPLKVSVVKDVVNGVLPMYAMCYPAISKTVRLEVDLPSYKAKSVSREERLMYVGLTPLAAVSL